MCDPVSIGLGAMALSGVVTAYGQYSQGQAASDAAKYQAKVAKNNAILADRAAGSAKENAALREQQIRARGRMIMGSQRAAAAAGGIAVNSETIADLQGSQAGAIELDALTERHAGEMDAYGYQIEGMNYRSQAELLQSQAQSARTQGTLSAAGTVLSTVGTVGSEWYKMGSPNPFASKAPSADPWRRSTGYYQRSSYTAF
jgi:uncharacterized protein YhbP (UPF0306 family)